MIKTLWDDYDRMIDVLCADAAARSRERFARFLREETDRLFGPLEDAPAVAHETEEIR